MISDIAKDGTALFASHPTSRRRFMKAATLSSLGTGFAIAALPVLSQAIKTDFVGIQSEEVTFDSNGTNIAAYTSRPAQARGKLPIIIVASEIFANRKPIGDHAPQTSFVAAMRQPSRRKPCRQSPKIATKIQVASDV